MRIPRDGKPRQDLEGEATPRRRDLTSGSIPAEHLSHFDIEQMWSVECLARVQSSRLDCVGRWGPEQ